MRLSVIAADIVDPDAECKRLDFASTEEFDSWLERLLAEADVVLDGDRRAQWRHSCRKRQGVLHLQLRQVERAREDDSVCV